ncbi:hypothetical protein [Criibacterium bergeronii]|nr:hypothetical protein [Criibacterium bergeronii]
MDTQYVFQITPENFMVALSILVKGMIGLFIVMAFIVLCVYALNNTFKKK